MKNQDDYTPEEIMELINDAQLHILEENNLNLNSNLLKTIGYALFNVVALALMIFTGKTEFILLIFISLAHMFLTGPGSKLKELSIKSKGGELGYCTQCTRWIDSRYNYLWSDGRIRCHKCSYEIESEEGDEPDRFRFNRGKGELIDALVMIKTNINASSLTEELKQIENFNEENERR